MKRTLIFTALTLATTSLFAADIAVTSNLALSANGANYSVASDGAAYVNSKDVQSILQDCGTGCRDWVLQTNYGRTSTRTVRLDFSEPAPGTTSSVLPSGNYAARLIVQAHNDNFSMLAMPAGDLKTSNMAVAFSYAGVNYRIAFNPRSGPYADTEYVKVTCNAADATGCRDWTVAPNGAPTTRDANTKSVGKLLRIEKNGAATPLGNYYFSFDIHITRP